MTNGRVIMFEYAVQDVSECRTVLTADNSSFVYVSESVEAAARELNVVENLTEMQMAI